MKFSESSKGLTRRYITTSLLASLFFLSSCGGGSSSFESAPPPADVISVTVTPASIPIKTGASQLFTAQVTGSAGFNPAVNWSVNGIPGGNSTFGTFDGAKYTAPSTLPNPSGVIITATSVQNPATFGTSTVTVYAPAVLTSITPPAASAGEQITINGQNLATTNTTAVVTFSGPNGTSVSVSLPAIATNQITVKVPYGATTGPISANVTPYLGITETTNSITFTRLPNLRVHASTKDLSSGEQLQLDWRLLGANTPTTISWKTNSGSITAQGLFQAPAVTAESYSRITGCIQNTNSCDTVLLRILPFRITPAIPIVTVGSTIQLDALQGGSLLSPQWSVLAGGGSIASGGLFSSPTNASQAGPALIAATANSHTERTSVGVSGAFPGIVNRAFEYADFTKFTPVEAKFTKSVAVSGNRAYALTIGNPFKLLTTFQAIDVYDISNPDQPVWIDAVEASNNSPADLFAFGNALFSLDEQALIVYSLNSQTPVVTQILTIPAPLARSADNGILYTVPSIPIGPPSPTLPIDLYDMTTGKALHRHYELPNPMTVVLSPYFGISGKGNIVYVSWLEDTDNTPAYTIATYDISQNPPSLLSTVVSTASTEQHLHVADNLLFADSQIYDISNVTPVRITTLPLPIESVWGIQGDDILASAGDVLSGTASFAVVNISSPSNPQVVANVADLQNLDIFNPATATWAPNGRFYTADGNGGFGVYTAAPKGGMATINVNDAFSYVYDQVIKQQTLYEAALLGQEGGLACFDLSSGTPNLLGQLLYPNNTSFAIQVSGSSVFLGMADSLKVIDVSNPNAPVEVGSVPIPISTLALSGTTLFAGTGDGRLIVFDVLTPAAPKQIASVAMPIANIIRLSGNLLLVSTPQNGFLIYEVSHPTSPVLLSQFFPTGSVPVWDAISIGNSAVMLAADITGIVILDISDPSHPVQLYQQVLPYVNAFPAPSTGAAFAAAFSLAAQNGLTYVGAADFGFMYTFDTTIPSLPRLTGLNFVSVDGLGVVTVITPDADKLYLALQGATEQIDNSIPQNSIELYDPPAALSIAFVNNDATTLTSNHKRTSISHNLAVQGSCDGQLWCSQTRKFTTSRNKNGVPHL